jgi:hypothetical protein
LAQQLVCHHVSSPGKCLSRSDCGESGAPLVPSCATAPPSARDRCAPQHRCRGCQASCSRPRGCLRASFRGDSPLRVLHLGRGDRQVNSSLAAHGPRGVRIMI